MPADKSIFSITNKWLAEFACLSVSSLGLAVIAILGEVGAAQNEDLSLFLTPRQRMFSIR